MILKIFLTKNLVIMLAFLTQLISNNQHWLFNKLAIFWPHRKKSQKVIIKLSPPDHRPDEADGREDHLQAEQGRQDGAGVHFMGHYHNPTYISEFVRSDIRCCATKI
jgi:hypothetical protein